MRLRVCPWPAVISKTDDGKRESPDAAGIVYCTITAPLHAVLIGIVMNAIGGIKKNKNKENAERSGLGYRRTCGRYSIYTPSPVAPTKVLARPISIRRNWSGWFSIPSIGSMPPVCIPWVSMNACEPLRLLSAEPMC